MNVFRYLFLVTINLVIILGKFWGITNTNESVEPDSLMGRIIYVNIENFPGYVPSADGSSWANAYQYLQSALSVAEAGDQIWVAEGVYYPDEGPGQTNDDCISTFALKDNVSIYGGFDPGHGDDTFDERDWQANITVLSGDIDKNDTNVDGNFIAESCNDFQGSNSYHVISSTGISTSTYLDGFIITAGHMAGIGYGGGISNIGSNLTLANIIFSGNWAYFGGGMSNKENSNPTLTNVTFSGNCSSWGGGMYNANSNPTLTDVTFSGNYGEWGGGMYNGSSNPSLNKVTLSGNSGSYGGGIFNAQSRPNLTNVIFSNNFVSDEGGGMNNYKSDPVLTDVTFTANSAHWGGGMYNVGPNSPTLYHVTFSGNTAGQDGGGMYNTTNSSPTLTKVTFSGNSADYGGGLYNISNSSPTLTDVTFLRNWADWDGGGMCNTNSHPTLSDVTFTNNLAYDEGGGMRNYESSPTLNAVTFNGNLALAHGGGISNHTSSPILTNAVFSGNSTNGNGGGICNYYQSSPTLTNVTFASNRSFSDGGGMFNENNSNPSLTNANFWGNTASGSGNQIRNDYTAPASTPTISFSDIQGSGGSGAGWDTWLGVDGGGNIDSAPRFVRDPHDGGDGWGDNPFTTEIDESANDDYGDLHPQSSSPAIDTGTNTGCPAGDYDGIPRPVGSMCDIGAYEWFVAGVTLEPDRNGRVAPGEVATYLHTLTNTGNLNDTFTLTAASSQGWIVEVKPSEVTVGIGASTTIEVKVSVPAGASGKDVTTVTATSNADSGVNDGIIDTTKVRFDIYLPLVRR
jgi:hypothetical protein